MLLGEGVAQEPAKGAALAAVAADAGDPEALSILATLAAAGVWGVDQSWPRAIDFLERAAALGSAEAAAQLGFIGASPQRFVESAAPVKVCESPRIWTAERFVDPAICAWLSGRGLGKFKPALMREASTGNAAALAGRTCSDFVFDILAGGVVMLLLRIKIARATGPPPAHMEPPQIFHYALGEEIKPHYDFLFDGRNAYGRDGSYRGDRQVTFLLYLNAGYGGGELEFVKAGYRYKGRAGDGIFFASRRDGKQDWQSLHAAAPVTRGEKFILSQWIHDRPFTA
jgi:hypothetical protein